MSVRGDSVSDFMPFLTLELYFLNQIS